MTLTTTDVSTTLTMTSTQVVETLINVITDSPQDYTHPENHTALTHDQQCYD